MSRARRRPTSVDALQELGDVERLLRLDTRAEDVTVRVSEDGARLSWRSWTYNQHARGSLTASAVSELAHSDSWGVSTIHDPQEVGDAVTVSTITVVRDREDR
jgi:hypothetical protein